MLSHALFPCLTSDCIKHAGDPSIFYLFFGGGNKPPKKINKSKKQKSIRKVVSLPPVPLPFIYLWAVDTMSFYVLFNKSK